MGGWIWNAYALVPAIAIVIQVLIVAFVLIKSREWIVARMFVLISLTVMIWNISDLALRLADPGEFSAIGSFFARFGWAGVGLTASAALHFSLVAYRYYEKKKHLDLKDSLLYVPSIVFLAILMATDFLVYNTSTNWLGVGPVKTTSVWWYCFLFFLLAFPLLGISIMYRVRKRIDVIKSRTELKWFIISLSIPVPTGTGNMALPALADITGLAEFRGVPFFSIGIMLSAICIWYAVFKYQMFDVKVHLYIRQSAIYLVLIVLAVLFFGGVSGLLMVAMGTAFWANQYVFYIVVLVVFVIMFKLFEKAATRIVERLFPSLKWRECEVGEIFLIHNSGLMITHVEISPTVKVDRDLTAGMLTSVQNFMADTMSYDEADVRGRLKVLTYGDVKLLIEHGECGYLVVVFTGYEFGAMRNDIVRIMGLIDKYYSNILRSWDGDETISKDINPIITDMLGGKSQRLPVG
jgi:hypothetical protein